MTLIGEAALGSDIRKSYIAFIEQPSRLPKAPFPNVCANRFAVVPFKCCGYIRRITRYLPSDKVQRRR